MMADMRRTALVAFLLVSAAPLVALAKQPPPAERAQLTPRDLAVASQFIAPCCWTQTLDVHQSDIAKQLRYEIHDRLEAGDTPDAIKADLVSRYGERIVAVPDDAPLGAVATGLFIAVLLAGLGMFALGLRWRKRSREHADEEPAEPHRAGGASGDEWDERLDAELRDI